MTPLHSLRGVGAHKTSLTPLLVIEVSVSSLEGQSSCIEVSVSSLEGQSS
jgi:hypothetical protein